MSSEELTSDDIDLSRGDEDVVFVHTSVDTEELPDDDPREELLEIMEDKGLEIENARVIGIFRDEFSLILDDDAKITLNGEKLVPADD